MMTGMMRPQSASLNAIQRSCQVALGKTFMFLFLRLSHIPATTRAAPMVMPGRTPARNKSPVEMLARGAITTYDIEGGMINPIPPAVAVRPVAVSLL